MEVVERLGRLISWFIYRSPGSSCSTVLYVRQVIRVSPDPIVAVGTRMLGAIMALFGRQGTLGRYQSGFEELIKP